MTVEKLQEIKETIKNKELEQAKNQGIIENIKSQWKKEYDFDDLESANKKLDELKSELDTSNNKLNSLSEKLLNAYDWSSL